MRIIPHYRFCHSATIDTADIDKRADPGTSINTVNTDGKVDNLGISINTRNINWGANPDIGIDTINKDVDRGANDLDIRIANADGRADNPDISTRINKEADNLNTATKTADNRYISSCKW